MVANWVIRSSDGVIYRACTLTEALQAVEDLSFKYREGFLGPQMLARMGWVRYDLTPDLQSTTICQPVGA